METSDSDYFESADEDVLSDNEDTATIKENLPNVANVQSPPTTQLNNMQIDKKQLENELHNSPKPDNSSKDPQEVVKTSSDVAEPAAEKTCDALKSGSKMKKTQGKPDIVQRQPVEEPICGPSCQNSDVSISAPQNGAVQEPPKLKSSKALSKLTPKLNTSLVSEIETTGLGSSTGTKPSSDSMNVNIAPSDESLWDDSELDWGAEEIKEKEEHTWNSESDDWETVENTKSPETQETTTNTSSWGSWGNWGVSSIITTATQGVSSLSQAISTAMDVPEPEELARLNKEEKGKNVDNDTPQNASQERSSSGFGLGNLVMGVSKFVEETGTKVISGGLDTLETIGKKTMEVLQEGDPGLKKKRAFLKIDQDKPVLSQLLREAKEKAEMENKELEEKHFTKKAKNYETLFDDHQGLVHLEALEMLSKQCELKLQTLQESYTESELTEMQETMDQVKELCEIPDEEEDEHLKLDEIKEKLREAVAELNIGISYAKLISTWDETQTWLDNLKLEVCDERELHQQAIETLAQLTAIAVEQFHKTGELLLVKEHRSTADEADSLVQLTTTLTDFIGLVAAKFSDKLNTKGATVKNKEDVNTLITNVFFEAANSSSYIQDAFQLLIPVIQVGAV